MNNFTDIPWVFRIADFLQPKEIVTALELVLYLGIIGPDTFRPMAELKVFPCPWVGQAEQIVLVPAYRGGEPSGFKDGLRQYDFRMPYAVLYDFRIKVRNGQFGKL